jgi:hypothetical protein
VQTNDVDFGSAKALDGVSATAGRIVRYANGSPPARFGVRAAARPAGGTTPTPGG